MTTRPNATAASPKPGLLLEAARDWNIDLAASFIVGDRWRDVEAGHRAGCQTIFVDYDYRERRPDGPVPPRPLAARSGQLDFTNCANGSTATCLTIFPHYA